MPVVLVGWVIFRATTLPEAGTMIAAMFSPAGAGAFTVADGVVTAMAPPLALGALLIGSISFLLPGNMTIGAILSRTDLPVWSEAISLAYCAAACVIAAILVLPGGYSPFLYFRF